MKLLLAIVALAICLGFRSVDSVPAPAPAPEPVKIAYPWTEWLKLRPGGLAAATILAAVSTPPPAPVPEVTDDDLATYLKRAILPAPPKKAKTPAEAAPVDDASTTKKPKIIDVGDFWAAPTVGPNMTDPVVIDPAYWAAKKTMFISRLFAALAKQVLNSTGTVTTTTESPNDALLKEIDTVLLSDVARAVGEEPTAAEPAAPAPTKPVDFFATFKTALKASAKAKKKPKPAKTPKPTIAAPTAAPAPTTTPHPTLDYSLLAKALLS